MRTVEDLGHLTQLQKAGETRFSSSEVSEFRSIFLEVTQNEPRMSLSDFKEMMSPVCPMGDKNSHAISAMWMEICDGSSKLFDFPDFLVMMRRLLDMNFANMNERLGRVSVRKVAVSPAKPTGEPVGGVLNLETLRLPDEASRSSALSARSARSTRSSQRRRLAEVAPPPAPPVPSIPGSAAGSVYSKAKET
eukprot:symbB.v1.2.006122.t1/scaffold364.1/size219240/19